MGTESNPFEAIHRREHPETPEEFKLKRPPQSRPQPQSQRLSMRGFTELGEQVVGSRHAIAVQNPVNTDLASGAAVLTTKVLGPTDDPITSNEAAHVANPFQATSVPVTFAPRSVGQFLGTMHVIGRWSDGHEEIATGTLHASARSLEDVPGPNHKGVTSASVPGQESEPKGGEKAAFDADFQAAATELDATMRNVIARQRSGVDDIEKEADRYEKAPPPASIGWELARLALVVGTSGIAAAAGSLVGGIVGRAVGAAAEGLLEDGLATAIEDGLKHPVEKALEAMPRGGASNAGATKPATRNSADGQIDFFSRQDDALMDAIDNSSMLPLRLQRSFRPLLRSSPAAATAGLNAIVAMIKALGSDLAKPRQAEATAAQYVAYRARSTLGAEQLPSDGGEVTRMDDARTYQRLTAPGQPDGLLDILIEKRGDHLAVKGARMNGVSKLVADRLLRMSLVDARIPIRIVLQNDLGFITRDEAARIRYSGFMHLDPGAGPGFDEPQELRSAEDMVSVVLSRTLESWGIRAVQTDDASKGGNGT